MKEYTFHIDSSVSVSADSEEEAREMIEDIVDDRMHAHDDSALVLDAILAGVQVGELLSEENHDD
jgi:hypothetical protein